VQSPKYSRLSHFAAKRIANLGSRLVGQVDLLGRLHSKLRDLSRTRQLGRTPPIPVSAKCVNVRQYPPGYDVVRLVPRLTGQVEAHGHSLGFKPYQ
jgi:hypothetical protein